jgi:hypothetical protein
MDGSIHTHCSADTHSTQTQRKTQRLSNGVLILGIQSLKENLCPAAAEAAPDTVAPPSCSALIRNVLVWLPALR